jgi:tetratricopeptide (TPR) repeat protein
LKGLADVHCHKGELKQALKLYTRCIRIFIRLGERRFEATAQCGLGNTYLQMGRLENALVCFEKDLALTPGDERAATYGSLALLHKMMGDPERAIELHHKEIFLVKESGDRDGERRAYHNLGIAYHELGVHDLAISYLEKARTIQQELGVP